MGGGPFVCPEEGSWVLHGVVSWGISCAHENFPGVYARVYKVLDWIGQYVVVGPTPPPTASPPPTTPTPTPSSACDSKNSKHREFCKTRCDQAGECTGDKHKKQCHKRCKGTCLCTCGSISNKSNQWCKKHCNKKCKNNLCSTKCSIGCECVSSRRLAPTMFI